MSQTVAKAAGWAVAAPGSRFVNLRETGAEREQPVLLADGPRAGKAEGLAQPQHRLEALDRAPGRVEGRERLPALVQAGRERARGRTGPQALSSSSDALRAALGGPAHAGGGAQPRRSAARELGSGWLAGRNEGGAAGARRHRRSRHRGAHPGRRTVDRGVPGGASHGLGGGGGQADGATQAEAEAWPAPAGPAHRGDDGVAGLVRRRSVANGTRVARAGAGPKTRGPPP